MENKTTQELMQSIVSAEAYSETHIAAGDSYTAPPPVLITVSRGLGSNGTQIARLVGEKLGIAVYDRTLMKDMARMARRDESLMHRLDERVGNALEEFIGTLMIKDHLSTDYFHRSMAKVIMGISKKDAIIIGRGAHILLRGQRPFRVRLEGSLTACSERMRDRLGIRRKRAKELVISTNTDRERFVRQVVNKTGMKADSHTYYDLMLNTDMFDVEQCASVVIKGAEVAGFIKK